ncbi:MAG: pentapeptide repeat-containing protein [Clostridiales bacterium]
MTKIIDLKKYNDLLTKLKIDCENCSGLCCVALYSMKTDGFPENKKAGKPCKNLMLDFRCAIHPQLVQAKMKGCLGYHCFGAGQMVTGLYYPDTNWRTKPQKADEIFTTFLTAFQLHQMLWYLIQALSAVEDENLIADIEALILKNEQLTKKLPNELLNIEVENYRLKVNEILKKVIAKTTNSPISDHENKDFLGKNFKGANLDGKDFSMALLIAANFEGCSLIGANFLGADMRDVNIKNTDLTKAMFLTQMQINTAKGNANTKLPPNICRPIFW